MKLNGGDIPEAREFGYAEVEGLQELIEEIER
jgi:hypothetical protein